MALWQWEKGQNASGDESESEYKARWGRAMKHGQYVEAHVSL